MRKRVFIIPFNFPSISLFCQNLQNENRTIVSSGKICGWWTGGGVDRYREDLSCLRWQWHCYLSTHTPPRETLYKCVCVCTCVWSNLWVLFCRFSGSFYFFFLTRSVKTTFYRLKVSLTSFFRPSDVSWSVVEVWFPLPVRDPYDTS